MLGDADDGVGECLCRTAEHNGRQQCWLLRPFERVGFKISNAPSSCCRSPFSTLPASRGEQVILLSCVYTLSYVSAQKPHTQRGCASHLFSAQHNEHLQPHPHTTNRTHNYAHDAAHGEQQPQLLPAVAPQQAPTTATAPCCFWCWPSPPPPPATAPGRPTPILPASHSIQAARGSQVHQQPATASASRV